MADQVAYVKSPAGELGTVPASELQSAIQNGYSQVAPEEIKAFEDEQKFGGGIQPLIAGVEGAASAATFGLSTGIQTALGADPEAIRGRREANPVAHGVGQVAGLVGSALIPGLGEANAAKLMTGAGSGAAKLLGLGAATSTAGKIGSAAVRGAVENAVFQAGDEVSKMLAEDPYQSVETAIANIGAAGAFGGGVSGAIGAVSPLWKATAGGKVSELLDFVKNKSGGIDGQIDDAVHSATNRLGLDVSPEVKARLSNDPWVQSAAKSLEQTDTTKAGRSFQEKMGAFKNDLNNSILGAFGKTADDIPSIERMSKYESGKSVGEILAKEVDEKVGPLAKEFEDLKGKYKDVELPKDSFVESTVTSPDGLSVSTQKSMVPGATSTMAEKLSQLATEQGWMSLPDSEIMGLVNKTLKNLPRQNSVKELGDFISQIGKEANKDALNFELKRAGQMIKGVLQDGEADVIMGALGKDAPDLVGRYTAVRSAWKDVAGVVNQIDDRLKIRGSTSSFARNIRDMARTDAETLINRLSGKGDADLLRVISENFPQTASAIKKYHQDVILKQAIEKAGPGEVLSAKKLVAGMKALSKDGPELAEFALSPELMQKVGDVDVLLDQLAKAPHNFSNTARTMDKLFEYVPATAVGMATMVAGGNPLMAGALGMLTKYLSKDAPDAVKLAMLKFMASGQPIEAGAFKATVDLIEQTIKGENAINSSVKNVFKSTRNVIPSKFDRVSEKERERLDKQIKVAQENPDSLLSVGGDAGYYMPEHTTAMANTVGRVASYLVKMKPNETPAGALDDPPAVSDVARAKYNRALDLAQKPLIVLDDISEGTLTLDDVAAVRSMYPALYGRLSNKLMDGVIDAKSKKESIPYKTRMSLSLFLGSPLDSTLSSQSIMAAQSALASGSLKSQAQAPQKGSVQKINKIASLEATPNQQREIANA